MSKAFLHELKSAPLTTASTIISAIVGVLSLSIAWSQFNGDSASPEILLPTGERTNIGNALLVLAFYLPTATALAAISRTVLSSSIPAFFFLSIIMAAVVNFLTIVITYISPPKTLSEEMFHTAQDITHYGSIMVFLGICIGLAIRRACAGEDNTDEMVGPLMLLVPILTALWGLFVWQGQILLSKSFLPEITYAFHSTTPPM